MNTRRQFCKTAVTLMPAYAVPAAAQVQPYPTRTIRLMVPFAPGGNTDIAGRLIAAGISDLLGQSVVVENRGGAGGTIAAGAAKNTAPDGYTLLLTAGALTISPAVYKTVPYDMLGDFAPIGRVLATSLVLIASNTSGIDNIQTLLAHARQHPDKLTYGSAGIGSGSHLTGELFSQATGIQLMHVPYKGSGPATTAVLSGEVDLTFTSQAAAVPHVVSGRVKALAVTSKEPSPLFPDTPTVHATVAQDFEAGDWIGVVAPKGTPQPVIDQLNAVLVQWATDPATQTRLTPAGFQASPSSPRAFGEFLRAELRKWEDIVRYAGIEKQ